MKQVVDLLKGERGFAAVIWTNNRSTFTAATPHHWSHNFGNSVGLHRAAEALSERVLKVATVHFGGVVLTIFTLLEERIKMQELPICRIPQLSAGFEMKCNCKRDLADRVTRTRAKRD